MVVPDALCLHPPSCTPRPSPLSSPRISLFRQCLLIVASCTSPRYSNHLSPSDHARLEQQLWHAAEQGDQHQVALALNQGANIEWHTYVWLLLWSQDRYRIRALYHASTIINIISTIERARVSLVRETDTTTSRIRHRQVPFNDEGCRVGSPLTG